MEAHLNEWAGGWRSSLIRSGHEGRQRLLSHSMRAIRIIDRLEQIGKAYRLVDMIGRAQGGPEEAQIALT
jgi:hypothetical protein